MSRSPLAYPLTRSADMDVGGAADLQTDIMRFMAILSLCLVAIFALVQSIPLTPVEPAPADPAPVEPTSAEAAPVEPMPTRAQVVEPVVAEAPAAVENSLVLTRPKWVPKYPVKPAPEASAHTAPALPDSETAEMAAVPIAPAPEEEEGFTLRFASDTALTRAVAAHHVGVYALEPGGAKRMAVNESRISFWDASTPNTFHEMEAGTVPLAVIDALARTGVETGAVSWGVTLPGKMKEQLDSLMQEHRGGSLIIGAGGNISWEAS